MPGSTGILDDFNRADSATTLGANWSLLSNFNIGGSDLGISSNQAYQPNSGKYIVMYWNPSTFGPDSECYMTFTTVSGSDNQALYVRTNNPGTTTFTGYAVECQTAGNWDIGRIDNGTLTQLGASATQTTSSGNKGLLEVIGSTITAYIDTGGGYTSVLSRTDGTYSTAGNLAFYGGGNNTSWRYDDFGGGTLGGATPTGFMTLLTGYWGP